MIMANETVAEHMYRLELPFIYRVHEEPDHESITDLNSFLHLFGYHVKGSEKGIPRSFQEIVDLVKGRPGRENRQHHASAFHEACPV